MNSNVPAKRMKGLDFEFGMNIHAIHEIFFRKKLELQIINSRAVMKILYDFSRCTTVPIGLSEGTTFSP
jgi:hypothetical protein